MDKYPRMFIISSVIYLLIGTVMGVMMASHALDPQFRFVHIHLNLFGFMAMMVFGVAYHILPRFMGKTIKYPMLIPVHFYFATIGLIGMLIAFLAGGYTEADALIAEKLFEMSAGFSTLAVFLFALNIITVLLLTPRRAPGSAPVLASAPSPEPKAEGAQETFVITASMKISEVLEKKPGTLNVFINAGFKALADPEKRKTMGEKLVLKTACQIRGINVDDLLKKLNGPIAEGESQGQAVEATPEVPQAQLSIKRGDLITLQTPVGHMVQVYPETKIVLERNYGGECFTCPGMAVETIEQTANMHNKKPEEILDEINGIVKEALSKA